MFCIYCGNQTDNETKICQACAAARGIAIPTPPVVTEEPAQTQQTVILQEPVQAQQTLYTATVQNFTAPNVPAAEAADPTAQLVKKAMGSVPALLAAIFMTIQLIASLIGNSTVANFAAVFFSIGLFEIMLTAAAWISYGTAKRKDRLPITAGLKMAYAVGVIAIVFLGMATAFALCLAVVTLFLGYGEVRSLLRELGLGSFLSVLSSYLFVVLLAIALVFILFIVFYAVQNANLKQQRRLLTGKARKNTVHAFPVFLLFFVGAIVVINTVDLMISGQALLALLGVKLQFSLGFTYALNGISGGLTMIFGGITLAGLRKNLKKASNK